MIVRFIDPPNAAFTHSGGGPCAAGTSHFAASASGTSYSWMFSDGFETSGQVVDHAFGEPGTYTVQLVVSNGPCTSLSVQTLSISGGINVLPGTTLLPNVLSPNGDGMNDCFIPVGYDAHPECFSLRVYDRWGQPVFEGGAGHECWNGTSNAGHRLADGVYYYVLSAGAAEFHGHVQLLR